MNLNDIVDADFEVKNNNTTKTPEENLSEYFPVEITTHNIYFHEESPILSVDTHGEILATCGYDGVIRLWKVNFKKAYAKDNSYKTATNSSIQIDYIKDLNAFSRPINCIRFCKLDTKLRFILAACSDNGRVVVFTENRSYVVEDGSNEDAYEVCCVKNLLFIGFSSGKVACVKMEIANTIPEHPTGETSVESPELKFELLFKQKVHDGMIQGISFNENYDLLATVSLDKTVKVHKIKEDSLDLISTIDQDVDTSRGLFKRILFEGDFLYTFSKNKKVSIYCYPFKQLHLQRCIGPLNSAVVKILKPRINNDKDDVLFICTKKSVYLIRNGKVLFCADDACYMAITDAVMLGKTLFLSSMDGFISTIRLCC
ncbi:Chromatin assembly factor 1 subunit [Glugoides intestinalis]